MAKTTQQTSWLAEVMLFSGRPNPQWRLKKKDADRFLEYWESAPLSASDTEQSSRLGYNGCRISIDKDTYWLINNGQITFFNGKNTVYKTDEAKKAEKWILSTAPAATKDLLSVKGLF